MAEAQLSVRPAESNRRSTGERQQQLARTLQAKVAQGYRVESQSDTQAVLRMGTRRRWFGVLSGTDLTYDIKVDEYGHTSSRRRERDPRQAE
jgi:hypothetical protein